MRIETELRGHLPKPGDPDVSIIEEALKLQCTQALVERGCAPASITFGEPWYEDDAWKIQGAGKEN